MAAVVPVVATPLETGAPKATEDVGKASEDDVDVKEAPDDEAKEAPAVVPDEPIKVSAKKASKSAPKAASKDKARSNTKESARDTSRDTPRESVKESAKESAKDGGRDDSSESNEPLRKVPGNMYMEVLARDLRLTATNAGRLKRIAARYFKATHKRLVVTGGTRTPARQAQLIHEKLAHGDDIIALYENKAAATEVRNAYRDAIARGLKRKGTIRAMREVIEAQMARGTYISKHLRSGAIDVRSWHMEGALERALREAVKQEPGVSLMDEREGAEPHFHLNIH